MMSIIRLDLCYLLYIYIWFHAIYLSLVRQLFSSTISEESRAFLLEYFRIWLGLFYRILCNQNIYVNWLSQSGGNTYNLFHHFKEIVIGHLHTSYSIWNSKWIKWIKRMGSTNANNQHLNTRKHTKLKLNFNLLNRK